MDFWQALAGVDSLVLGSKKIGQQCVHVSSAGQLSNVYMVIQDCVRLRERN